MILCRMIGHHNIQYTVYTYTVDCMMTVAITSLKFSLFNFCVIAIAF